MEGSHALTPQRLLHYPPAGPGDNTDSILAYIIQGFKPLPAALFWSSSDCGRSSSIALVHLEFLFRRKRHDFTNRSPEASGCARALSICSQSNVCVGGDGFARRSDIVHVDAGFDRSRYLYCFVKSVRDSL